MPPRKKTKSKRNNGDDDSDRESRGGFFQGTGGDDTTAWTLWIINFLMLIMYMAEFITLVVLNSLKDTELVTAVRVPQLHSSNTTITVGNVTYINNATEFCTISHGHFMTMDRKGVMHIEWVLASMLFLAALGRLYIVMRLEDHMLRVKAWADMFMWIEMAAIMVCMSIVVIALDVSSSLNEYFLASVASSFWAACFWFLEDWSASRMKQVTEEEESRSQGAQWWVFWVTYFLGVVTWVGMGMTLFFSLGALPAYVVGAYFIVLGLILVLPWIELGFYYGLWDGWFFGTTENRNDNISNAFAVREIMWLILAWAFVSAFVWLILGSVFHT